jgi:hypothetical protein
MDSTMQLKKMILDEVAKKIDEIVLAHNLNKSESSNESVQKELNKVQVIYTE